MRDEGGGELIGIISALCDIFYPRRCALCDSVLPVGEKFSCRECARKVRCIEGDCCVKCGKPVGEGEEYCLDCGKKETTFVCGRAAFLYEGMVRESLGRFKYHGRREYAAFYADAVYRRFAGWIGQLEPDALIPVPIHRERMRERGYNQAELIAAELGRLCGVPVIADYLVRVKNTLPQKELSGGERLANLCQAFSVRSVSQELYNSLNCVIIVDDIYTTGSTIEACAQALCRQGISRIYFLCVSTGQGL